MTVETKRDPKVGKAWLAWFALIDGDEPIECVGDFVADAQARLGDLTRRRRLAIGREDETFLSGLRLFLIGLDAAIKGSPESYHKVEITRQRGASNHTEAARLGHRAAALSERLEAANMLETGKKLTKNAVADAAAATGLGRTEIYRWRRHRRALAMMVAAESAE